MNLLLESAIFPPDYPDLNLPTITWENIQKGQGSSQVRWGDWRRWRERERERERGGGDGVQERRKRKKWVELRVSWRTERKEKK